MKKLKLSVVWAAKNEEENIARSILSVKNIASEMIVVDEYSTDLTANIARNLGAKVILEQHHDIFHITKQKALEVAKGDWILQLDADEVVTPELSNQILEVLNGNVLDFKNDLFTRHQSVIEKRDGKIGKDNEEIVGYFIPRRNMFLGKPLIHAGVYPDGVIRLVKTDKAHFPQKSVHEQIHLDGRVGWLSADLLHYDSPTLKRYMMRLNRYTDLKSQELHKDSVPKNALFFINYSIFKFLFTFFNLYIRHLGFKDGVNGFLWSFFSASHFPIAYFKYYVSKDRI